MAKWERYVSEHNTYRECYSLYTQWLQEAKERVHSLTSDSDDIQVMEDKKEEVQVSDLTCENG